MSFLNLLPGKQVPPQNRTLLVSKSGMTEKNRSSVENIVSLLADRMAPKVSSSSLSPLPREIALSG